MDIYNIKGPMVVYIRILEACNAGCKMCGFARSNDLYRLPLQNFKNLADELLEIGTKEIRFTGGEPTLHEDIFEAIKYTRSIGMKASLITNGSRLVELADELIESGINRIICSIDSPRPDVHNFLRRTENLLEDAFAGLSLINAKRRKHKSDIILTVNTIISSRTYEHLYEFIPLLEAAGVDTWTLNPIKDIKNLFLSIDDIYKFNEIAEKVNQRLKNTRFHLNAIGANIFGTSYDEVVSSSKGCSITHTKCYIPYFVAYIDAKNGVLSACNCLAHREGDMLKVNGIWEKSIFDIWNAPEYVENRKKYSEIASLKCNGCEPANVRFNSDFEKNFIKDNDEFSYNIKTSEEVYNEFNR